jgi:DNA gyrase inhibitor GyrI
MSELNVNIVDLPPLRVASAHAYGPSPEHAAWEKLVAWAKPQGLLDDPEAHPIYGFNNPDPSPGSPNYGYEFWIVVGPEVEPEDEIKIAQFSGGRYGVARCETRGDIDKIGKTWRRLVAWREKSAYGPGHHQWLEKHISGAAEPDLILDLYIPITG